MRNRMVPPFSSGSRASGYTRVLGELDATDGIGATYIPGTHLFTFVVNTVAFLTVSFIILLNVHVIDGEVDEGSVERFWLAFSESRTTGAILTVFFTVLSLYAIWVCILRSFTLCVDPASVVLVFTATALGNHVHRGDPGTPDYQRQQVVLASGTAVLGLRFISYYWTLYRLKHKT